MHYLQDFSKTEVSPDGQNYINDDVFVIHTMALI
jgi:hypothetical protein